MGASQRSRSRDNSAGNRTREELISVAAALFAERGVDAVSLAEINRVAGQKNNSAVTYHFGSKVGLIEAIQDFHTDANELRGGPLLDLLNERNNLSIEELMSIAIVPVATKLRDGDGGGDFIIMLSSLFTGDDWQIHQANYLARWERWRELADGVAPPVDECHRRARVQALLTLVVHSFADWERRRRSELDTADLEVLVETIINAGIAMFACGPKGRHQVVDQLLEGSEINLGRLTNAK